MPNDDERPEWLVPWAVPVLRRVSRPKVEIPSEKEYEYIVTALKDFNYRSIAEDILDRMRESASELEDVDPTYAASIRNEIKRIEEKLPKMTAEEIARMEDPFSVAIVREVADRITNVFDIFMMMKSMVSPIKFYKDDIDRIKDSTARRLVHVIASRAVGSELYNPIVYYGSLRRGEEPGVTYDVEIPSLDEILEYEIHRQNRKIDRLRSRLAETGDERRLKPRIERAEKLVNSLIKAYEDVRTDRR